jgi:hypothetical protein
MLKKIISTIFIFAISYSFGQNSMNIASSGSDPNLDTSHLVTLTIPTFDCILADQKKLYVQS